MKKIILLVVFHFSMIQCAVASDEKEIMGVLKEFTESIESKDESRFLALFLSDSVSWVGVYEDKTLKNLRSGIFDNPDFTGADTEKASAGSPKEFITGIVNTSWPQREEYTNVNIRTDGSIASVTFDYVFYEGKFKSNWGEEYWGLVKTENGWKINSVIFSMILPDVPGPG